MKLFCSGLRCPMRLVFLLVAVLLPRATMLAQTATTTALAVSPASSPLAAHTVVTLTATVEAGATHVHPGLVTFCNATAAHCTGLAVVGTAQLTIAGTATLRFIPGSGSHSYHAVFAGTRAYTTSTSAPQPVIVSPAIPYPTTTSIAASGSVGDYTLTATVVGTGNSTQGPTGNVSFADTSNSNNVLGMATLGSPTLARSFINAGAPVPTGTHPYAVVVGDFNGDGIADVAVAENLDNTVTILLGNGSGGFSAVGSPIAVGTNPQALAVGDFNGDGFADLAVANYGSNNVSILLGDGHGAFTPGPVITVGSNPIFVAVGDFNSDGIADLAVPNFGSHTVSILLGDGHGGFAPAPAVVITVDSQPADLAVGDFNGDGIADLAVADYFDNSVSILLGNGTGTFTPATGSPIGVGSKPKQVVAGDFNDDGLVDLAVANDGSTTVVILLGDGHGGFTPTPGSPVEVGSNPAFMAVADLNGDGTADLAVANSGSDTVTILLGDGEGGFTQAPESHVAVGSFPLQVAAGDFNGDGMADLVVANAGATNVSILLNYVTQTATAVLTGVRVLGTGTHNVHTHYPGDANFNDSTSPTIPLTASQVATTTTLALSAAGTIAFGTPVTLTAHVEPHMEGSVTATGTVTFDDATAVLGTAPISSTGDASIIVSTFALGIHPLTAMYGGSAAFMSSTSAPVTLTVDPAPIELELESSLNPTDYGQTVTFTATVSLPAATGAVQFLNNGVNLGSPVTIVGGVASLAISTLRPGMNPITAHYPGDGNHLPVTSAVLNQQVLALPTTTTLTVSPPNLSLAPHTVVTLTATVTSSSTAVHPGRVTFCDATPAHCTGLALVGTAQLTPAGTAVLRFIPASGSHSYTAVFAGTLTYAASTSTPQAVTVSQPSTFPTTTAIASSGSAANYTLTATVVGTGDVTAGPTGNVSFLDTTNSNTVGTAPLGGATLARSFVNAPVSPITVGTRPEAVAVGDFNGDGVPDLAVTSKGSNSVSIFLGTVSGGFTQPTGSPITVGSLPEVVAVGDFNGDGHADLAVANEVSNTVSILLGNGDGTFTSAAPVPVGISPFGVAVGDFNGDGIADLAVTNHDSNNVSILLGNGDGTFTSASPVAVGSFPVSVAVGDFNGDGIADLAVTNFSNNNVSILLGNGDGTFTPGSPVAVGGGPVFVAVGDFNGDGIADLAVANSQDNTVSILQGNGDGTFAPGSPIAVGTNPFALAIGDFNGDGNADLAVPNFTSNNVIILRGNGDGTFTPESPLPVAGGPYGVAVGDFNGDGIADLAVTNATGNAVSILLNTVTQTATAMLNGVSIPGGGTHDVEATYPADTNFETSTSQTIPLMGSPVVTATSLALSTEDTTFGTPVILTANVTPHTADGLTATGTVNFHDGLTPLGSAPISATGEATIIVSTFAVGVHSLTAMYSGDANFITSTSAPPVPLTVEQAPVPVTLASSDNPSDYGEPVTFTATVPPAATGTIRFMNGLADLSVLVPIVGGVAGFTTSALTPGTHQITAVYSGDAGHLGATSAALTQTVAALTTATTLTVSPPSSQASPLPPQAVVTLTATVTTNGTAVSPGLVRFCDADPCVGLAVLGTAQLTPAGTAVLRLIPGSGAHSYIAVFVGTTTHTTSTSTPQSVTVSSPSTFSTTTAITSSGSAGNYTLTATVVGTGNATLGPTGNATFVDTTSSNNVLGTATLGTATLARGFANGPGSPIGVGSFPVSVAVGDFDGNGIADLAVVNLDDNTVSILLGNGSGGFVPASGSPVMVGAGPYGVAVGDFDGDGHADLAVANTNDNTVSIFLGHGDGTFAAAPGSPFTVGTHPYLVAVGDFNGDGIADLAVTNFTSNNVSILLGDGHGGFTQPSGSPVAVGGGPYGIAVADFDGDGHADLAVTNQRDGNVSILLGNGSGGFAPATGSPVAVGTFPVSVAVGDFDGNGIADLAVANVTAGTVSILLGNGSGGFTPAPGSPIAVGTFPNSVVVGDFNGDRTVDLAVANFESNDVSILLGNGSGGFTQATGSPVAVGSGPYAVAAGDFNGDGMADLAVPNYFSNNLSVLLNQVTQTATAVLPGVSIPGSATHNVEATYQGDTNFDPSTSPTIPLTGSPVATATSLSLSTSNTIAFGTPVTLTASVAPYTADHLTATGTIAFDDGTTVLGTEPISSTGQASITVSTFAVAVHSLTAVYTPADTNFIGSPSNTVSLTVHTAPIAVSLMSSLNPSGYGQPVTFTATVPSGATGTIQFMDSAAHLGGPVTLVGGVAAFETSALTPGTHLIMAAYSGDGSHAPGTSDVELQMVHPAVLTVTANNISRPFNQPNGTLGYAITGFIGSDTQASTVTGTPIVSTTATGASPVGSYPIAIGQGSLAASNYTFVFMNGVLSVTSATPGTGGTMAITLAASVNPSSRGESVIFTATLPPHATGQVTFKDGANPLGTATIIADAASFSTSQLAVGTHPITAVYGGDTNYAAATSAALSQVVNETILVVAVNDAQRQFGQSNPTFTTTITGFVGGDTQAVVTGAASVTSTATPASSPGIFPIVATQGTLTATNYSFAFVNGNLTVTPAIPGVGPTPPVTLAPSLNPAPLGSPVTFTATVPAGATGTVSFYDGTTLLGTATITGNTASLSISTLGLGTHTITAVYSGDANFTPTTTTLSEVVISAADFTVASSTGRQLIPPGASANFTIVVSSMNGPFTNSVTMSASGMPPGATYTFSPAAVTPGAAGANTTFTVSVPKQSSMASRGRRLGPVALALLLLPFAFLKRHRGSPQRLLLWVLVALVSFGAVSGCGEGGYFSQPEQTYTITVTGTSGNLVRSTTVTLTVE